MPKKLRAKQLALSIAVLSGLFTLVLWLLANNGIYVSAAAQMAKWHTFFDLSFTGLIIGIIEAVIMSYVVVYVFVWIYNWVGKKT